MLLILIGKSCSGKDTLLKQLVKEHSFKYILPVTSRPMREGEENGRDYEFISKEDILYGIEHEAFIEWRSFDMPVNGVIDKWYFGTPSVTLTNTDNFVLVSDPDGTRSCLSHFGAENCFVVEVTCPDDIRKSRAQARSDFDEARWKTRLDTDTSRFAPEQLADIVQLRVQGTDNISDIVTTILAHFEVAKLIQNLVHPECTNCNNYIDYLSREITEHEYNTTCLNCARQLDFAIKLAKHSRQFSNLFERDQVRVFYTGSTEVSKTMTSCNIEKIYGTAIKTLYEEQRKPTEIAKILGIKLSAVHTYIRQAGLH